MPDTNRSSFSSGNGSSAPNPSAHAGHADGMHRGAVDPARANGAPPRDQHDPWAGRGAGDGGRAAPRHATTHGDEGVPSDLPKLTWRAITLIGVVGLVLIGALFLLGWLPHEHRRNEAMSKAQDAESQTTMVDVIKPRPGPTPVLLLPGDLRANQSTSIRPRATGYLKPLPPGIDIGAHVTKDQVIAEISAPDVDAQLEQARAALEQAKAAQVKAQADYDYSKATVERYQKAANDKAVAVQDLEDKKSQEAQNEAQVKAAIANVEAARATVQRFEALQGFQRVTAPFTGLITARGFDAGALINGSATDNGPELFHIDETDILRLAVSVPQESVDDLHVGLDVDILVKNFPGRVFPGKVARLAGAIDLVTRTMRIEIDVPNPDGLLVPGMYSQARFHLEHARHPVVLPTSALIFNAAGMRVATVSGGKAHLQNVELGRDFGTDVEIVNGLESDQTVINSPSESLAEGAEVTVRKPRPSGDMSSQGTGNVAGGSTSGAETKADSKSRKQPARQGG